RPDAIKIDAQDMDGSAFELNLTGLAERVFQHEYDHLHVFIKCGALIRIRRTLEGAVKCAFLLLRREDETRGLYFIAAAFLKSPGAAEKMKCGRVKKN
ncbi:hypothetical protein M569_17640, partial [Genlisea aurea]